MAIDLSRAQALDGWMSSPELRWLAEHALDATCIVEVGCFVGRSTRALAEHTRGVVYAVDTWRDDWQEYLVDIDPPANDLALQHPQPMMDFLANTKDLTNLFVYRGTMETLPPVWPDMVFLDGDHHYGAVASDIENALRQLTLPKRRRQGLLCGHDYHSEVWPEVTQAVDAIVGAVQWCESIWWARV